MRRSPQFALIFILMVFVTLACVTNTPIAKAPTPRPTRTALPTFTITPLPPTPTHTPTSTDTPTPTLTPTITDTPISTDTPTPTETSSPTPVPTDTPIPRRSSTATPVPTATAAVVINSPLPTPTSAPVNTGTQPGEYKISSNKEMQDCSSTGVVGKVTQADGSPIRFVNIEVKGESDKNKGPFIGTTDEKGQYVISMGTPDKVRGEVFEAKVVGNGVSSKKIRWVTAKDCKEDGTIQLMEINWVRE